MCGLVAVIALNGAQVETAVVDRMTGVLRHRGPDDFGRFVDGGVGLGFRRLSILDLSPSGHQPMVSHDGRFIIVYNGEIYNYLELRNDLQKLGYIFRSSGDTEVLLYAYAAWGRDCLPRLNGMWAFLIYDIHTGMLFGSRDRFGVKPLYYCRTGKYVLLASEIKAILSSGYYSPTINWRVASAFLVRKQLDDTDDTFFQGIVKIPAGSAFELDLEGNYKEWRYWSLSALPDIETDDPSGTFADLFEDAVRIRMRSDVPVGVSLSGGLDSTSIICAMARQKRKEINGSPSPLVAFTYSAPEFNESAYVNDTLLQTHAQLVQLETDAMCLLDKLDEVLWYYDEPVHTITALVGYELMRLAAANGVKVILGGQGADETIAGYPSYFPHYWETLYASSGLRRASQEIAAYRRVHGGSRRKMIQDVLLRSMKAKLRDWSAYRGLARWRKQFERSGRSWFTGDFLNTLPEESWEPELGLDAALRTSIERRNLPLFLRVEDRNSMAHSVEMRLPFMDYRLISYALKLPANWKMRGPWNKYVLRESMRNRIPDSVRTRVDKMGFPVPHHRWLAGGLRTALLELLETKAMRERGIYSLKAIRQDLESSDEVHRDLPFKVFDIVQFETWCQLMKNTANAAHPVSV